MIRELSGINLYHSSFYRILRGETRSHKTRGFEIKKLHSVDELNELLARFELLFCCSQDLFLWHVDEMSLPSKEEIL
jgi:hypothetical protein